MESLIFLSILCLFIRTLQCDNTGLTCSFEEDFCGWTNYGWERKMKSAFITSGPSSAADGTYYIQINTNTPGHTFIIKANFQKTLGTSCLKFRHHLYGNDVKYLRYGYYNGTLQRIVVTTISNKENFWRCSTFILSSIPESATDIYFEAESGSTPFSIIGLDDIEFHTGSNCSTIECPTVSPPVPTTQKTESTTTGERRTDNNDTSYIIGGVSGGLVIIATIIIIVCILKMRKRDNKKSILHLPTISELNRALPAIPTPSEQNRALPATPQNNTQYQEEVIVLSVAESFDTQFSDKPATSYANISTESKQGLTLSGDCTGERTTELLTRVKSYGESDDTDSVDDDYLCPVDDDYLCPSVEIEPIRGNVNQYESDPTKKGKTKITNECGEPPTNEISAVKIPSIPVMGNCNASTQENDTSDDYADAEIALIKNGTSRQKTEHGSDNTGYNSDDSANGGEGSPGNDKDDYLEINNTTDDEYDEPANDNHSVKNPKTTVMSIVSKTTQEEDNNSDKNNAPAIPIIPHNQGERIAMSRVNLFDKKASLTPVSFYNKNSIKSKQELTLSSGITGEDETPDYANYITPGDDPGDTNSQDDDYLYPSVGIEPMIRAKENQYISDPTDKGEEHTYTNTIHEECNEPVNAIRALKIPAIPVMRNGNVITLDNVTSDEYDDAEIRDGASGQKTEDGNKNAGYNSDGIAKMEEKVLQGMTKMTI